MTSVLKGRLGNAGQCIGIIALSSPCERQRLDAGLEYLKSSGVRTKVALDPSKNYGRYEYLFSSDSPKARAEALQELFRDPEVTAILVARGAYGVMEILPLIDFDRVQENPKPLIGFSDTTTIISACYARVGLSCIHGPSLEATFSKASQNQEAKESAEVLLRYLAGKVVNPFKDCKLELLSGKGRAEGRLVGGNLSVFLSLLATPWEPPLKGHILFLEEANERPYRIHRMLLQLKLSGRLNELAGVLLGSFSNCVHEKGIGPSLIDVIKDIFGTFQYPVMGYIPAGHIARNLPLPIGIKARMFENQLELNESAVLV